MRQLTHEGSPHMERQAESSEALRQPPQLVVRDLLAVATAVAAPDLDIEEGERRWQERANCLGVDPDLFFPERGASTREAKAVCGSCEVRPECLEYALDHAEKFGIWGGLSERERRRLRRQRALARRNAASA
jgi:WhiB family transcriptional regulator, redox-sensing transcriptional regulator